MYKNIVNNLINENNINSDTILNNNIEKDTNELNNFKNIEIQDKNFLNMNCNTRFTGTNEFCGNCSIYGNMYLNNDLISKSNIFSYGDIFINNSINISTEKIDNIEFKFDSNYNYINKVSYDYLLNNIITLLINDNLNIKFSSIKFYSEKNKYLAPSIVAINKKFILNNSIIMSFGLFYCVFLKKKIIIAKPLSETFTLIDKKYNLIKINDDHDYENCIKSNNLNNNEIIQKIDTDSDPESNYESYESEEEFKSDSKSEKKKSKLIPKLNLGFRNKLKKKKNKINNKNIKSDTSELDNYINLFLDNNINEDSINSLFNNFTKKK